MGKYLSYCNGADYFFKNWVTSVYHYVIMGLTQVNQNKLQKGVENGKADYFIRW